MTAPACLRLADEVFPRVRAIAARRLAAQGWSQARIGEAVGLSQAMVSRHLAAPEPLDAVAHRLADDLVQQLLTPEARSPAGPSAWCSTLSIGHEREGGEEALRDLLAAERMLRDGNPVRLMPQVGLNLARAVPEARSTGDVLAFPGRLIEAGGRILNPAPPAFGGSGHLARVLLALREADEAHAPRGRRGGAPAAPLALANVRTGADVLAAAKGLGWPVATVRRGKGDSGEGPVLAAASAAATATALQDPGAVGLEPCLYIMGSDAAAVAARILDLHDHLVTP